MKEDYTVVEKKLNKIILLSDQRAVDAILKEQHDGFRKDLSCIDQIATTRIVIEESVEWNTFLYVNFVDHKTAFDSLVRRALWCLVIHMANEKKFIRIIETRLL